MIHNNVCIIIMYITWQLSILSGPVSLLICRCFISFLVQWFWYIILRPSCALLLLRLFCIFYVTHLFCCGRQNISSFSHLTIFPSEPVVIIMNFDFRGQFWKEKGHKHNRHFVTHVVSWAVFIIFPKSRNTFQYPLSKRVCKCLSKRLSWVVAFIIELYREYESRGRPCHCATALRSLTRGAEIM